MLIKNCDEMKILQLSRGEKLQIKKIRLEKQENLL
jgi:hypothetical protein